jgi:membrane protein
MRGLLQRLDRFQQRHEWAAFPFGVFKKYGDDQGGNLAALITYYGFLSLFPLFLVLITVLAYVLQGNTHLQKTIVNSALADFPVLGDQIKHNVHSLRGSGLALIVGLLIALYGGLGVANAAQNAMNRIWEVPMRARPGFFPRIARSLGLIGTIGIAVLATMVVNAIASASVYAWLRSIAIIVPLIFDVGLFLLAFRVLTAREVPWREHLPGAIVAAIGYEILQLLGGWYVAHMLRGTSQSYGLFAFVLGLLAWIYLQTQVVLLAAEVNVVRRDRLWPRSLAPPPLTEADVRAYEAYGATEERAPQPAAETTSS